MALTAVGVVYTFAIFLCLLVSLSFCSPVDRDTRQQTKQEHIGIALLIIRTELNQKSSISMSAYADSRSLLPGADNKKTLYHESLTGKKPGSRSGQPRGLVVRQIVPHLRFGCQVFPTQWLPTSQRSANFPMVLNKGLNFDSTLPNYSSRQNAFSIAGVRHYSKCRINLAEEFFAQCVNWGTDV